MARAVCAVCESTANEGVQTLYETPVCRTCWTGFTARRPAAFAVDVVAMVAVTVVFTLAITGIAALYDAPAQAAITGLAPYVASGLALLMFAFKDGLFDGRSPGKALFGLRVVDDRTRRPIEPGRALVRTLPLLVPFVPLVAAAQLGRGPRLGDGAAGTRVVWDRHLDREPFVAHLRPRRAATRPVPAATTAPVDPWD